MSIAEILLDAAYQDTQLLQKNDSLGDDFKVLRNVDFVLTTNDLSKARIASSFINDNRYGNANYEKVGTEFRVTVTVFMPTCQHILCSVSGLMACVGKIFGLTYDGWGCVIQG